MIALPSLRLRLARLVRLREVYEKWRGLVDEQRIRLLDQSIVATMGDLEDAGLSGVEIGRIVSEARKSAEVGK